MDPRWAVLNVHPADIGSLTQAIIDPIRFYKVIQKIERLLIVKVKNCQTRVALQLRPRPFEAAE